MFAAAFFPDVNAGRKTERLAGAAGAVEKRSAQTEIRLMFGFNGGLGPPYGTESSEELGDYGHGTLGEHSTSSTHGGA